MSRSIAIAVHIPEVLHYPYDYLQITWQLMKALALEVGLWKLNKWCWKPVGLWKLNKSQHLVLVLISHRQKPPAITCIAIQWTKVGTSSGSDSSSNKKHSDIQVSL